MKTVRHGDSGGKGTAGRGAYAGRQDGKKDRGGVRREGRSLADTRRRRARDGVAGRHGEGIRQGEEGVLRAGAGVAGGQGTVRDQVEVDVADAFPCLQTCSSTFQECLPPVKTVPGLGLTPSALSTDFSLRKHEVRRCRREHESCSVSCNLTDARTIAMAKEFRFVGAALRKRDALGTPAQRPTACSTPPTRFRHYGGRLAVATGPRRGTRQRLATQEVI